MVNLNTLELITLYKQSQNALYGAYSGDICDTYLHPDDSTEKLKKLLNFQLDNVSSFIQYLYNFIDRNNGKQNCLQILGPPNSCKTLFAQIISEFCICVGKIANFNKYSQFPLQNCINKRLLYWDEPDCEPSGLETIKMLFAGDPCAANIKFKDHHVISKTPIIVTANRNIFPINDVWLCRMRTFTWKQYDIKAGKKLHPISLIRLFEEYVLNKI